MQIPEQAAFILSRLTQAGYQAYVVGGCVRDALLGIAPQDWDICTSALPEQVKQVFPEIKTIDVGIKHGTVALVIGTAAYEVTTFRTESGYTDSRRPDCVYFVDELQEDLLRRDFTVNAMAYNPWDGLVDVCGGQADLKKGQIRTVGNPGIRFGEDALRILRCLRFASVYGFRIETETGLAVLQNCDALQKIAVERVNSEFSKLLCGINAAVVLEQYRRVPEVFIPDLAQVGNRAYREMLDLLERAPASLPMRLAVFFSVMPTTLFLPVMQQLKYSRVITEFAYQCRLFTLPFPQDELGLRVLLSEIGYDNFKSRLTLKRLAGETVTGAEQMLYQLKNCPVCYHVRDLALNGKQIAALGYGGQQIGRVQRYLQRSIAEKRVQNDHAALLAFLREHPILKDD